MKVRGTRFFARAAVLCLVASGGLFFVAPAPSFAEEKPARERVEALLEQLESDEDAVRERAETQLFALGESGRQEMERLSRSSDPVRAATALRLLQSNRWSPAPLRAGEQPLQRTDGERLAALETELRQHIERMRTRFERALHELPELELPKIRLRDIELPEIELPDVEWPRVRMHAAPQASMSISGMVSQDDRRVQWTHESSGKTTVSVTEEDGEPQTYSADSIGAFRAQHADIAALLDELAPSWTGGPTLRFFDGVPGLDIHQDPGSSSTQPSRLTGPAPVLGIGFEAPSAVLRHHLGIESGVVVTRVLPGSMASELGLQSLDIVLSLSGKPVTDAASIRRVLQEVGDGDVTAEIIRRGRHATLRVPK